MISNKTTLIFICIIAVIAGILALNLTQPTIRIRWATESELDVTGYNLYRANEPDGTFVKINTVLLPPADDPFIGGEHTYTDTETSWGKTYYYQLETIDRSGNSSRSTTITLQPQLNLLTP